jgi:hypothetical protein
MARGVRRIVFLLVVCCLPSPAQIFRGGIFGTVEDASGKRVPSAKIVVYPLESPTVRREATSDIHGEFRMDDLSPGVYVLIIRAAGFAARRKSPWWSATSAMSR